MGERESRYSLNERTEAHQTEGRVSEASWKQDVLEAPRGDKGSLGSYTQFDLRYGKI